jgi:hypothetical protein
MEMLRGRGGGAMVPYRPAVDESGGMPLVRYALPWALWLVVLGAGVAAHLSWGAPSTGPDGELVPSPVLPWITAAMTPAVAGLTWLAWTVARTRQVGPAGRAHVAATVAIVGLWLLFAMVAGPFARGVIDAWGLVGPALAVSWNIRAALHRPRREDDDGVMNPRKAGKALLASLGMRGGEELIPEEANENRIAGKLLLTGQNTAEDVQKNGGRIATALGIPKAGVRITENPQNAAEPEFSFTMRDMLTTSVSWPGPSHVGGTPFDPIPMGFDETGALRVKVVADQTGAKHELIQGMQGSGKSSSSKIELCDLMTRRETALIVIDCDKELQTFGPAAAGLTRFIVNDKMADRFFKRLIGHVIKGRARYLGARRLSEWVPGCGLSFVVVQIEEAGNLLARVSEEELQMAVLAARSVGIAIKFSLQRPSHDQIPTTLRANLGNITCFGMGNDDPVCLLPDKVQDAGADPRQWNNRQPGCCYMAGTGITIAQAAVPMRTFGMTVAQMEQHAQHWGPRMDPIDPTTVHLFGDLWRELEEPLDLVARLEKEALQIGVPGVIDGEAIGARDEQDDEEIDQANRDDEDEEEAVIVRPEEMGIATDDDDPADADVTFETEIEGGIELQFGPPSVEVSVEEARAAVADRLAEFEQAGRDTIRVPDFAQLVASGMRSRAWFRKELLRLVDEGRLVEEGDGVFRIVSERRAA